MCFVDRFYLSKNAIHEIHEISGASSVAQTLATRRPVQPSNLPLRVLQICFHSTDNTPATFVVVRVELVLTSNHRCVVQIGLVPQVPAPCDGPREDIWQSGIQFLPCNQSAQMHITTRQPLLRKFGSSSSGIASLSLAVGLIITNQPAHHALELYPSGRLDKDWFELRIGRFQTDVFRLAVKFLHRGISAVN